MSITFVLRSPYEPGGRYIKKFSHKSVLGWFQSVWDNGKDTEQILGVEFYGGIGHLLDARLSENLPMPNSEKELVALLHKHSYVGAVKMKSGCLEIETDNDEMYLCQYMIESSFAKKYPQRTKFLLRDGWLPTRVKKKDVRSRPKTFIAARYPSQTCDSIYWDFFTVKGSRLETIGDVCTVMQESRFSDCYSLQKFLETVDAQESWKDTIQRLATSNSFPNKLTTFRCSKHVCELYQHEQIWQFHGDRTRNIFTELVVYDDLWAKSHPLLHKSLGKMKSGAVL